MNLFNKKVVGAALALLLSGTAQADIVWSGTGNFGTAMPNGDIGASPEGGSLVMFLPIRVSTRLD